MSDGAGTQLGGRSVLVVEDEVFVAMALEQYITEAGAREVATASSIAEARNILAARDFDAAILDVRLPDGDGHVIAQILFERGKALIFHSGEAIEDLTARFPDAVFCHKPAAPGAVVSAISGALERTG